MEKLIRHSGNYRKLLSYQKTEVIFEMTYYFCHTYLQKGDRTIDQMVQAARSGKQNIIEGCAASATSAKTEIKLVNVAKASLQELLEDYIDYLRTHGHRQWEENSVEWTAMRRLGKEHNDAEFFMKRSYNFRNLFDPETGFSRVKDLACSLEFAHNASSSNGQFFVFLFLLYHHFLLKMTAGMLK